jgi:hypothetical protein
LRSGAHWFRAQRGEPPAGCIGSPLSPALCDGPLSMHCRRSGARLAGSSRPLVGLAVWVDRFQKARAVLRGLDLVAIRTPLLPRLWIGAEGGGTALHADGPNREAADASKDFNPHQDERDWLARLDRTMRYRPRHTLSGIEPAAVPSFAFSLSFAEGRLPAHGASSSRKREKPPRVSRVREVR